MEKDSLICKYCLDSDQYKLVTTKRIGYYNDDFHNDYVIDDTFQDDDIEYGQTINLMVCSSCYGAYIHFREEYNNEFSGRRLSPNTKMVLLKYYYNEGTNNVQVDSNFLRAQLLRPESEVEGFNRVIDKMVHENLKLFQIADKRTINIIEAALKTNEINYRLMNILGMYYQIQREFNIARRHFESALSIQTTISSMPTSSPQASAVMNNIGSIILENLALLLNENDLYNGTDRVTKIVDELSKLYLMAEDIILCCKLARKTGIALKEEFNIWLKSKTKNASKEDWVQIHKAITGEFK